MADYIISIDRATSQELNAVHEVLKEHSNGWWHHFTNVWFVSGLTAVQWRDMVKAELTSEESAVLVLRLPDKDENRAWAFWGKESKKKCRWIHDNYS